MGTISAVPARLVRLSAEAWRVAEESGAASGGPADMSVDEPDDAWQELDDAGIATGRELDPAWRRALDTMRSPQVVVRITAVFQGISGRSTLSISGPHVVCVNRRRSVEVGEAGGVRITGAEAAVEVSLFSLDTFWDGVRRVLPPLPQVRAGAAEATSVVGGGDAVSEVEAMAVALRCTAQVTAEVLAPSSGRPTAWAGMWAVHDGRLYSIRTRGGGSDVKPVVVPVQSGHIAREVGFALVGALGAAGGAASAPAPGTASSAGGAA